jgi:hypothetical protein
MDVGAKPARRGYAGGGGKLSQHHCYAIGSTADGILPEAPGRATGAFAIGWRRFAGIADWARFCTLSLAACSGGRMSRAMHTRRIGCA